MLYFKLNDLLHISQTSAHSALCTANDHSYHSTHWMIYFKSHLYGCSTQWMHWCTFRKPCSLNDLLHVMHVYGHFLLCMQCCLFRAPRFLKDLLYTSHLRRQSSLSMQLVHPQITLFSEWFLTNITFYTIFSFPSADAAPSVIYYNITLCRCSQVCMRWCTFKSFFTLNDLL